MYQYPSRLTEAHRLLLSWVWSGLPPAPPRPRPGCGPPISGIPAPSGGTARGSSAARRPRAGCRRAAARLAVPTSAASPAESMKLTWSKSTTSGRPLAANSKGAHAARSRWKCRSPGGSHDRIALFVPDLDSQCLSHGQLPSRPNDVRIGPKPEPKLKENSLYSVDFLTVS